MTREEKLKFIQERIKELEKRLEEYTDADGNISKGADSIIIELSQLHNYRFAVAYGKEH